MGDGSKISWTDATWNPVRGCSRFSEGCRHCYAEAQAARIVRMGKGKPTPYDGLVRIGRVPLSGESLNAGAHDEPEWIGDPGDRRFAFGAEPRWTGEVVLDPARLADPLRWRRPRRIFVNSMSDLFHESLTNEQIAAVFGGMAAARQHTFQCLTKRAARMRVVITNPEFPFLVARARDAAPVPWPLPNVWLGVSIENQAAADERIPELLETPAALRFLSCEPLLGRIDLDMPRCDDPNHGPSEWSVADDDATPWCTECDSERSYGHWLGDADEGISWVIAGCESGPGARPCDVAWLRSLRDQCAAAGRPFFCKQAVDVGDEALGVDHRGMTQGITFGYGSRRKPGGVIELPYLDGVQHSSFPHTA